MMVKEWYIKWEPMRWRSDPAVSGLSTRSKGTWFQLLNVMFIDGNTGEITGTLESITRMAQLDNVEDLEVFLQENEVTHTAEVNVTETLHVTQCNKMYQICNRKVTNDNKQREDGRLRVAKHRAKQQCNNDVTPKSNSNSNSNSNNTDIYTVFDHWMNLQNSTKHREITQAFETSIGSKLKLYSVDEICSAMDEFDFVCGSPNHYWDYSAWTIKEFLHRGLEKFLPENKPRENFKAGRPTSNARQESDLERKLREKKEAEAKLLEVDDEE